MECFSKETIFWLFCMGVPMFMAYNGGATAATVDTIQEAGKWSATGIGLLGAMDKIGITLSAGIWGFVLQHFRSKLLLSVGLLVNAVSCAVFAVTQNGYLMYATKMLIGFTEGLQWVWAPLWVARWADEDKLPLWINLSGCVAAGVGNGIGMLLAGSTTGNGLPYAFPFQIEAAVLMLLFILMIAVPADRLAITSCLKVETVKNEILDSDRRIRSYSDDLLNIDPPSRQTSEAKPRPRIRSGSFLHPVVMVEDMTVGQQFEQLWHNKLYCRSAMAFASANYVNAGLAFIWIRLFVELWKQQKSLSTVSYLLITGLGGAYGIYRSSNIDGGSDARITLSFLSQMMVASCLGAVMTVVGLLVQLIRGPEGDIFYCFLILTWVGVFVLCMGIAATTGLIQIVCNNSVEDEKLRSFGVGLAQGINNFFGNCFGPLLPQMVMDLLIWAFRINEPQALFSGAVAVVCIAFGVLGCVSMALRAVECNQNQVSKEMPKMQAVPEDATDQQPLLHPWCCNY